MKHLLTPFASFLAIALFTTLTGCSQKAKLETHLASANTHFEAGDYQSAEIEYKNVMQIDSTIPEAIGNLGIIYLRQGRIRNAYPFLTRSRDVDPENLEYRRALSSLFLEIGDGDAAWEEARFILERDALDPVAPLILQGAAARLKRIEEARATLQTLREANESAALTVALGMLHANEGNLDSAVSLFEEAVEQDPNFSDGHAALGSILWARNEKDAANAALRTAYETGKGNAAKIYRYAVFKLRTGDNEFADGLLDEILEDSPSFVPALTLKAQLAGGEQKLDEAIEYSDKALRLTPYNPDAIALSAKLKIGKGEIDDAILQLERATEIEPELAGLHYQLALAYLAGDKSIKASASLTQTLALDPGHREATLIQASLNAKEGEPENAIISLEKLLEQNPENVHAQSLLAQIHFSEGQHEEALEIYQALAQQLPSSPQPPQLAAEVLLRMGKTAEAREALETSLERNVQFLPALERITDLDISEKQYDAAISRIVSQLADYPDASVLHFLKGKVHINSGNSENGVASLKKAIELQPTLRLAHLLLATHYSSSDQVENALRQLNALIDVNPKDVVALLQIGTLHEKQKDFAAARDTFESMLKIDPKHAVALNNLAYINSEFFEDFDKAYDLAMRARDLLPNDPSTADTLGWINYKRGDYDMALSLVQESVRKIDKHPEIQYHLAKIHQAREENEEAKTAFANALEFGLDGAKADEAKQYIGN